jgi:hypothetical protein
MCLDGPLCVGSMSVNSEHYGSHMPVARQQYTSQVGVREGRRLKDNPASRSQPTNTGLSTFNRSGCRQRGQTLTDFSRR